MTKLIAACLQVNAAPLLETNFALLAPLIRQARAQGAELITTPENVSLMVRGRDKILAQSTAEHNHPAVAFFSRMALETKAWILAGSLAVIVEDNKLANRSYMFNPEGKVAAHYDKIHMFDADVGVNESYRESANFRGGDRAVVADTPWGKLGLTICYDVRFPHLYRALAKAGATIITVPAAFTVPTGKLHWHVLLRARAIETGCYILAPAQCGVHESNRATFGHSLIIAPSGEIIAEAGDTPGIITAELDLSKVDEMRRMLPSLKHDCDFKLPRSGDA